MSMAEFFEPDGGGGDQVFFTACERSDLTGLVSGSGQVKIEQIGDAKSLGLQLLHETYEPGADTGRSMLSHASVEGGIVVSGELEVTVGDQVRVLKPGDGFLFDSTRPHRFRNISGERTVIFSACTPPWL